MAKHEPGMSTRELVGRLAVLGIPEEVAGALTFDSARAIHETLGEYLANAPEAFFTNPSGEEPPDRLPDDFG